MAYSSSHSFHFQDSRIVARSFDLGSCGGSVVLSNNSWDSPITIFLDDKAYAARLCALINCLATEEAEAAYNSQHAELVAA